MTYFPSVKTQFSDSPNIDAFTRLRVNSPNPTLFDNIQSFGDNPLVWENKFSGSGTATHLPNESSIQLSPGGSALGHYAYRQTRQYFFYQPGKSQLVMQTFVFDSGSVAGLRRRIGYFDANNGYFLEQNGTDINFVERNSVSGSVVDTVVSQSAWNFDKFDGSGPSGVTLDLSKGQILVLDLQWLSTGRVRLGFDISGQITYAHQFLHANLIGSVYMTSACQPLRCEIENVGTTAVTGSMRQICSVIVSEGGSEGTRAFQMTANNGRAGKSVTTRVPVLSIRAKTTGPNNIRNTGRITPKDIDIFASTISGFYEIVLNGTLTSASFNDVQTQTSITQWDSASTAISGGYVIDSGYVPQGAGGATARGQSIASLFRDFPLVYTSLNNQQDVLSVVVESLGGATAINADIVWQEQY